MKYYVKCSKITTTEKVPFKDEEGTIIYYIKKKNLKRKRAIEVLDENKIKKYQVDFHPLKTKGRYRVLDTNGMELLTINTGIKIIHKIVVKGKHYICKSNLFKIRYWLYENDTVIARLKLVKIDNVKYFEINLEKTDDMLLGIILYVVAQAQRYILIGG